MVTNARKIAEQLPREMEAHTYPITYEMEGKHWWFVGRRRIITTFVEEICHRLGKRDPRILDVGCGSGWMSEYFARLGYEVKGIDISPALIEMSRDRVARVPYDVDHETTRADQTPRSGRAAGRADGGRTG